MLSVYPLSRHTVFQCLQSLQAAFARVFAHKDALCVVLQLMLLMCLYRTYWLCICIRCKLSVAVLCVCAGLVMHCSGCVCCVGLGVLVDGFGAQERHRVKKMLAKEVPTLSPHPVWLSCPHPVPVLSATPSACAQYLCSLRHPISMHCLVMAACLHIHPAQLQAPVNGTHEHLQHCHHQLSLELVSAALYVWSVMAVLASGVSVRRAVCQHAPHAAAADG